MAILIKGMEMPKNCDECDFHTYHSSGDYVCVATPLFYPWNLANDKGGRKDFCPLVEVPDAQTEKKSLNGDVIDRQAAIDVAHDWYEGLICGSFKGLEKRLRALPSAQPDYDKIIAEIKQCITETREHGKHHAKFVQDNGELYISGLEMALSIIEENR